MHNRITHVYTFNNVGKSSHKYDLILNYVAKNYKGKFTRKELLFNSGYLPEGTYYYNGYLSNLTTSLNELGIIVYNPHIRKWIAGPGFFQVFGEKTVKELSK